MTLALMPMTPAERQRRRRARLRAERAREWLAAFPAVYGPFLSAWADRGLKHPPTPAQLELLRPWAEQKRGAEQLGRILALTRRARPRHSPTTYRLVASVLRRIAELRQLAQDVKSAWDTPLRPADASKPPRRPAEPAPDQLPLGRFGELLRRAGLKPELADELERERRARA